MLSMVKLWWWLPSQWQSSLHKGIDADAAKTPGHNKTPSGVQVQKETFCRQILIPRDDTVHGSQAHIYTLNYAAAGCCFTLHYVHLASAGLDPLWPSEVFVWLSFNKVLGRFLGEFGLYWHTASHSCTRFVSGTCLMQISHSQRSSNGLKSLWHGALFS